MSPVVFDCFHGDVVHDWGQVAAGGIRAVILKATQGTSMRDPSFAERRTAAASAGMLVGAYHFLNNEPADLQVANFLECIGDTSNILLALDWEESKDKHGNHTASVDQAKQFLQLVFEKTGQRPVLYSGSLLKEKVKVPDPFLNQHRLWLSEYGPRAKLPPGWDRYWLWQYTGDGEGPMPHDLPGVSTRGVDLNVFGGQDLAAEWIYKEQPMETADAAPMPSRIVVAAQSQSVWTLVAAGAAYVSDKADQAFHILPELNNEAASMLNPLKSFGGLIKVHLEFLTGAIVLLAILRVALRHTRDKQELVALQDKRGK